MQNRSGYYSLEKKPTKIKPLRYDAFSHVKNRRKSSFMINKSRVDAAVGDSNRVLNSDLEQIYYQWIFLILI